MQPTESVTDKSLGRLVAKNTFYLTASQALTVPIAILVNATTMRYLGAVDFGVLYFASTLCGFAFLLVNWGHDSALPALISRSRAQAAGLLGSSIAWRVAFGAVVYPLMSIGCHLFGYGSDLQWALGLTFVISGLASLIGACKDSIRGFERTDIPAYVHVGQQFLTALLIVPALLLGGGMKLSLFVQIPVSLLVLALIWRSLRPVGIGALSFRRDELKSLMTLGTPFVFVGLVTSLQPVVDVWFLSRLAPADVMGWFAVSRRLIGVLLFPAAALTGALYPTLCRLHAEDRAAFVQVARGSLSNVALLAVPLALGCGLYPEIGVALFSRKSAGAAAEDNLRILSVFLFLLYFSMPIATCILAAGRQRAMSTVQALCVFVSLFDWFLVPWFQKRYGNGALGVCVAAVISEGLVVACGLALMPRGIVDRVLVRTLFLSFVCGGVMALVAYLMRSILPAFVAAPIAVVTYGIALWATGAIEKSQIAQIKGVISRKFARAR
jgi:O-antigen/teichoic acid export membrane protein